MQNSRFKFVFDCVCVCVVNECGDVLMSTPAATSVDCSSSYEPAPSQSEAAMSQRVPGSHNFNNFL